MKTILIIGLPSDLYYPPEVIEIINKFDPEVVLVEWSKKYEEIINDKEKCKELIMGDLYSKLNYKKICISPRIENYKIESIVYKEYFEGKNIQNLLNKYERLAVIIGGGHLPLNEAPVETPLIEVIMHSKEDIHFKLINYFKPFIGTKEYYEVLRRRIEVLYERFFKN